MADYNREAAHRRYEQAAQLASEAGSNTQAGVNEAYRQLYQNAEWTPDAGWAAGFQEGAPAYISLQQFGADQNRAPISSPVSYWGTYSNDQNNSEESALPFQLLNENDGNFFSSSQGGKIEESEKQYTEDGRELNPQFINNPRYLEMMNGVSDMGSQLVQGETTEPQPRRLDDLSKLGLQDFFLRVSDIASDPETTANMNAMYSDETPDFSGVSDAISRSIGLMTNPEVQETIRNSDNPENSTLNTTGNLYSLVGNDALRDQWREYFNNQGSLEKGYKTGMSDVADSIIPLMLNNKAQDINTPNIDTSAINQLVSGLDKIANENYDDGTMRADSVKSKYIKGSEMRRQREAGFPGRPLEEIDDNATYNKLDEMRDFGYTPYIEDMDQANAWNATQVADDLSKAYSTFGKARDLTTDAKINYNDQKISHENFFDNVGDYFNDINQLREEGKIEAVSADDPSVDPDSDLPMTIWWTFPGTDIEIASDQNLQYQWSDDGSVLYAWLPGHEDQAVEYDGLEDYEQNIPEWHPYRSEEGDPVHSYWKLPRLEYTEDDGTQVSLSYKDAENIAQSAADGSADIDWGFGNIAKNAEDRKGFGEMLTTGDFSDLLPNMTDLALGSAPLFTSFTAWPMALSNAVTASQGLDARLYDMDNGSYNRLAGVDPDTNENLMTGEKYLSNIALSGLVPATERVAGIIGGSGGMLGKPLQAGLQRIGAPAAIRSAVDVLGEGAEESVASAWEDYQVNGLDRWFADPVYETDENGNVLTRYNPVTGQDEPIQKYDSTNHEIRDSNTPLPKRVSNWADQQLDNVLAGSALGLAVGGPGIISDARNDTGYYAESRDRKLLRDIEKMHNLPRFREAKRNNNYTRITPEDIGTFGKRER